MVKTVQVTSYKNYVRRQGWMGSLQNRQLGKVLPDLHHYAFSLHVCGCGKGDWGWGGRILPRL